MKDLLNIEVTYEDLVQLLEEKYLNLDEFIRVQDDLCEDYESWLKTNHYTGTEDEARMFLLILEENL